MIKTENTPGTIQATIQVPLRVLIVAEHASARFGGEAALPLHYYRLLRQRGIPVWLVVHARTRTELEDLFPHDAKHIVFVEDTAAHRRLWQLSRLLPHRLSNFTAGFAMRVLTQITQRRVVKQMVSNQRISVIHQPMPVSPKEPSLIHGMGAPVIIGPMNGGIDFPPAFHHMQSRTEDFALAAGRSFANLMNRLLPGKRLAALLLVANDRTRKALPSGLCNRVETMVENGVDLELWRPVTRAMTTPPSPVTHYAFVGRLVDWKAVDLLLHAFSRAASTAPMTLTIIGDGIERPALEQLARELGILSADATAAVGKVCFSGWMSQADCVTRLHHSDALVLPSLMECGGAVVLEAMATGIPAIATDWGGPADYIDEHCGILVAPVSRTAFIENMARALIRLATSPEERRVMGQAARARVIQHFDWEVKIDRMLELYRSVIPDPR
ncbi:MAG: glycosyltransferase family 4 protein [Burkholderiales bacterium]|nr:glycosyltransferase family 4 protein [Burkholderiales bacterium]